MPPRSEAAGAAGKKGATAEHCPTMRRCATSARLETNDADPHTMITRKTSRVTVANGNDEGDCNRNDDRRRPRETEGGVGAASRLAPARAAVPRSMLPRTAEKAQAGRPRTARRSGQHRPRCCPRRTDRPTDKAAMTPRQAMTVRTRCRLKTARMTRWRTMAMAY